MLYCPSRPYCPRDDAFFAVDEQLHPLCRDKEEGEYQLGYWSFLGVNVDIPTTLTLDSEINKSVLGLDGVLFVVKNDNDVTCIVRFYYDGDEL